jgi:hypothetical protein
VKPLLANVISSEQGTDWGGKAQGGVLTVSLILKVYEKTLEPMVRLVAAS